MNQLVEGNGLLIPARRRRLLSRKYGEMIEYIPLVGDKVWKSRGQMLGALMAKLRILVEVLMIGKLSHVK